MAKDPDGFESWLLPQFLVDDYNDETFAEFRNTSKRNGGKKSSNSFGMDFKRDFGYEIGDYGLFGPQSDLGSPFEGSTETESDDDYYISELTQKIADSSLHESAFAFANKVVFKMLYFCISYLFIFFWKTFSWVCTKCFILSGLGFVWFTGVDAFQCYGWWVWLQSLLLPWQPQLSITASFADGDEHKQDGLGSVACGCRGDCSPENDGRSCWVSSEQQEWRVRWASQKA